MRDWKVRSTKVDAGDFKLELLNRLRSTMAVNVLIVKRDDGDSRSLEMSVHWYKTIRRHMREDMFTVATMITSYFVG